jgi:hypothetical protein
VLLDPREKLRLERLAAESRRSISAEAALAILAWLDKHAPKRER